LAASAECPARAAVDAINKRMSKVFMAISRTKKAGPIAMGRRS
jgi:hypothetical protein